MSEAKEVSFPGLSAITGLSGLGAFLTAFTVAYPAVGAVALIAWILSGLFLFICVGFYFQIGAARLVAIFSFAIFALIDIGLSVMTVFYAARSDEALASTVDLAGVAGLVGRLCIEIWAVWYLMRPKVRDVFIKVHK